MYTSSDVMFINVLMNSFVLRCIAMHQASSIPNDIMVIKSSIM